MLQATSNLKRIAKRIAGQELAAKVRLWRELSAGEPELRLIPAICDSTACFLDVGANEGVYSYYARRYSKHVYALEPHPGLAERLRTLLGASGTVLPVAASDHSGIDTLSIPVRDNRDIHTRSSLEPEANPGFATREVEVTLARVADLRLPPIGAIKIDVEGHEMKAVIGAQPMLVASHPILIVECEERHNRGGVAQLMSYLGEIGYDSYFIHRGQLHPGAEFDVDRLQGLGAAKSVGTGRSPDYVNNFLFVDRADRGQLDRIGTGLDAPARLH